MTLRLTTNYHWEGKFCVADCVELGVTSQGESLEEAKSNLQEAVELYLEDAPREELSKYTEGSLVGSLDFNLA